MHLLLNKLQNGLYFIYICSFVLVFCFLWFYYQLANEDLYITCMVCVTVICVEVKRLTTTCEVWASSNSNEVSYVLIASAVTISHRQHGPCTRLHFRVNSAFRPPRGSKTSHLSSNEDKCRRWLWNASYLPLLAETEKFLCQRDDVAHLRTIYFTLYTSTHYYYYYYY